MRPWSTDWAEPSWAELARVTFEACIMLVMLRHRFSPLDLNWFFFHTRPKLDENVGALRRPYSPPDAGVRKSGFDFRVPPWLSVVNLSVSVRWTRARIKVHLTWALPLLITFNTLIKWLYLISKRKLWYSEASISLGLCPILRTYTTILL